MCYAISTWPWATLSDREIFNENDMEHCVASLRQLSFFFDLVVWILARRFEITPDYGQAVRQSCRSTQ